MNSPAPLSFARIANCYNDAVTRQRVAQIAKKLGRSALLDPDGVFFYMTDNHRGSPLRRHLSNPEARADIKQKLTDELKLPAPDPRFSSTYQPARKWTSLNL
jgi:hypothetical protein